jgi:hypothetical protein
LVFYAEKDEADGEQDYGEKVRNKGRSAYQNTILYIMNDTSQRAEQILIEGYRVMSPAQKFQQVSAMNQAVRKMALTRIRAQYHPTSEREETIRLAALWLPRDTMIKFLNWDPEEKGY